MRHRNSTQVEQAHKPGYSGVMVRRQPPPITPYLFTDERVSEDALLKAARRLPRGGGIVFRHYRSARQARAALFARLRRIARRRGLCLLVAGELPRRFADHDGRHGRKGRGKELVSMPVHDVRELERAVRMGADAIFISPVFATRSHAGAPTMGPVGYRRLALMAERRGMVPLALGGMTRARASMLDPCAGYGAIDQLSRQT